MTLNKNNSLNIGMILDGYYPNDIRVRKEAESLSEFYSVYILCCKNKDEKEYEEINKVKIFRWINYRNNIEKGLIDILLSINFIHPYFFRKIKRFINDNSINVIHIHDLPMAKSGYLAGIKKKIPIVLDLHENYPAALSTWFIWRKNLFIRLKNNLFFGYKKWSNYEKKYLPKYNKVVTVVEEMKERILKDNNLKEEDIVVIANSEKKEFVRYFESQEKDNTLKTENEFVISYVGGFGPHRGLHIAIEGMKDVVKTISKAKLVLVGPSNRDVKNYLYNLVDRYNLNNHVDIREKVPFKKVVEIMKMSDVNIIPHISNEHTNSAVPHKMYQILLSGKPLLVSDCAPMKRIVDGHKIGYVFEAGNPKSFSKKVIQIYNEPKIALQKAKLGFDSTYYGTLNWEHTSKTLIKMYQEFSS